MAGACCRFAGILEESHMNILIEECAYESV